jgi:hypothetical protein
VATRPKKRAPCRKAKARLAPVTEEIPFPGHPSVTTKVWDAVLDLLREGRGLRRICREHPEFPIRTVILKSIASGTQEQKDRYARACEDGADAMIEEAADIADDGSNDTYLDDDGNVRVNNDVIQRSKLRVEQRRWHAGKLKPKKYGDKLHVEDVTPPLSDEEIDRRIAEKADFLKALLK